MFMPVRDLCRNYHIVAKHLRVEPKCYSKFLKSLTMLLTYGVFGLAAVD